MAAGNCGCTPAPIQDKSPGLVLGPPTLRVNIDLLSIEAKEAIGFEDCATRGRITTLLLSCSPGDQRSYARYEQYYQHHRDSFASNCPVCAVADLCVVSRGPSEIQNRDKRSKILTQRRDSCVSGATRSANSARYRGISDEPCGESLTSKTEWRRGRDSNP